VTNDKPKPAGFITTPRENATDVKTGTTLKISLILLALTTAEIGAAVPVWPQGSSSSQNPASAISSMKVEGELIKVQGRYYVIKDAQGKEMYLLVGPDTELAGQVKPGDQIEVWTSPIEHAIAIRAASLGTYPEEINAATRSLKGKLIAIEGKYYVLVGTDGKEIRLLVNQDTELAGAFRLGEQIEVFTSPVEHAVAIRSTK